MSCLHSCCVHYRADFQSTSSKCSGCAAVYLFITPHLVFLNDPVDHKTAIPAHRTSSINTKLSSRAGRDQTGFSLFCCGLGGAEVTVVNRTLDPNWLTPGNWLKKWPVPPTHAQNGVRSSDFRLQTVKMWEERVRLLPSFEFFSNQLGVRKIWNLFFANFEVSLHLLSCIYLQSLDEAETWVNPCILFTFAP